MIFPIVVYVNRCTKVVNELHVIDRLLIWLDELLADIVSLHEIVLVRLSCIVKIAVEVEELAPSQVKVIDVLMDLLAHVDEVLPCHSVVDHRCAARLFEALSREESGLFTQIVHLL